MSAKRRAAFAGLLLIGLLTSCSGVRGEGMFAYRDHEGRAAIYNLASGRVIWRSDCTVHTRPEWSPKGDLLGFAFTDPSDGHEYVGYVELGNMTVAKVHLSQTAESFFWPVPGGLEWSPSGAWLMLESGGYLGHAAVIVDIHKLSIVHSFVTTGRVLWSPDGDRICYAVVHGKAVDPESYDYRFDLVSVDLRSGQSDIVFSGEQGNWITPLEWTDTIIFRYGRADEGFVIRDVAGRQYTGVSFVPVVAKPPAAVTAGLAKVGGADQNSTGAWLVEGCQSDDLWWVYYSPDDSTKAVRVVRGDAPSWRPEPG